jgi:preprotein translocase SecA subunit
MFNWLKKINPFAETEDKTRRQYKSIVEQINQLEPTYEQLSNDELREQTEAFRIRLARNEPLDDILPEAFATVREASRRTIGMRHYDVQLIGGMVLHEGKIAEMKTGEGKTLVATLPLYLNALTGKGAHLITVNDYLARRDAGWMGPIYYMLGMQIGFIGHSFSALFDPEYVDPSGALEDERLVHWRPSSRKEAYAADITYGTNNEFGFDYLRDNLVHNFEDLSQREHHYAIVDEVDNILIDEARTPLIISGPASKSSSEYARFAKLVSRLRAGTVSPDEVKKGAKPDGDVLIDLKSRSTVLTEEGLTKVEQQMEELGEGESVYDPQHSGLTHYLENALKAKFIFHLDKDYVVQDNEVIIVDEFTGRLMPGRRWSDGLHQAVEAKEGVQVQRESVTYATVTFQNYFRMYTKLSGMTGTAATEREEFAKIYDLDVMIIPTNKPCIRDDQPDLIYRTVQAKYNAVIQDIRERASRGQPVLVGTTAVESSETLSQQILQELGDIIEKRERVIAEDTGEEKIIFHVLNAKQNADEAAIVAQAGQPYTVTIATNMAGRGTDIILGGNAESLASRHLKEVGFERKELEDLAASIVEIQKKGSPETIIQRSEGRLTDNLIPAIQQLRDSFDTAIQQMEKKGETQFLIETLLHTIPASFYEQKRELVRAILKNNRARATRIVQGVGGMDEQTIAEIQHTYNEYMEYRNNRRNRHILLAGKIFEQVYTARARLVQLVLRGDIELARELIQTIPGLHESYVDDILHIQQRCIQDQEHVKEYGGLYVVGTERHEARRIDNQLRGRSGRQGDEGASRFYLSLEDELMLRFGRMDMLKGVMEKMGVEDDQPIESNIVSKSIEKAQERVEGFNFDMRKHTVDYDDVMNKQREVIYTRRRRIIEEADEQRRIERIIDRHYRPDQLLQELREVIHATATMDEEIASERIGRLLPEATLDIPALQQSNDEAVANMLLPLIEQQQKQSRELLFDELEDIFIELPEEAIEILEQATYEEALDYTNTLWRDLRQGDLEERIKTLFATEFDHLINRYIINYDGWLRDQIREAVNDAVNPATDEVNFALVERRIRTILPEIEELDITEVSEQPPDKLQRTIESLIPANKEEAHNYVLLIRELRSFMPIFPPPLQLLFVNLPPQEREKEHAKYIQDFANTLAILTETLPEEDQQQMEEEAIAHLNEQLQPVLAPTSQITTPERKEMEIAIQTYEEDLLIEVFDTLDTIAIQESLNAILDQSFERWRDGIGMDMLNNFQRILMLQTIDREWQEYLTAMEDMRQGIGLQAIGQRDPLVQYKTTAFRMFGELQENIDHTVVHSFFQQLPNYHRHIQEYEAEKARQEEAAQAGYEIVGGDRAGDRQKKTRTVRREEPKTGPNDSCPCGSGKKFKHCHGRNDAASGQIARGRAGEETALVSATNSGETISTTANTHNAPPARGKPKPTRSQTASGGGGGSGGTSRSKKKKRKGK